MPGDESSSSQEKGGGVTPGDPWGEVVARTGMEPEESRDTEPVRLARAERRTRGTMSRRRGRIAAAALSLVAVIAALACVVTLSEPGSEQPPPPGTRPVPPSSGRRGSRSGRRRPPSGHAGSGHRRAPGRVRMPTRVRAHHGAVGGLGHADGGRGGPEPSPAPAPPPSLGAPEEMPPPSEPVPEMEVGSAEAAPSREPGTGGGLRDGSHGSPEFGL